MRAAKQISIDELLATSKKGRWRQTTPARRRATFSPGSQGDLFALRGLAEEIHQDLPRVAIGIIAAEMALPRRTLQRALGSEGVTYREIVRCAGIRRAQQLLATTEMTLAEVALRTGYSNPSNFHRAFQWQTGMTPGRFREAARQRAPS